jgi:hypothetical protein
MSPTLMIIGIILIILAVSGCIGGSGGFGDVQAAMNGRMFCHDHGYDAFTVDSSSYYCLRYGVNETISEHRRIVKLANGDFAFALSSGGG